MAEPAVLSEPLRAAIDRWVAKYPPEGRRSAVLGALREAQHENGGHLTPALMDAVAEYLALPPVWVYEAATFYSMLELGPVGRHCISVCTNISCMLNGADAIVEHLERRLGITLGESTPDGRYYLKREEECLAACTGAPVMQVDHRYVERLTTETVDRVLAGLD